MEILIENLEHQWQNQEQLKEKQQMQLQHQTKPHMSVVRYF